MRGAEPAPGGRGRSRFLPPVFLASLILLLVLVATVYVGNLGLAGLLDDERQSFEKNIEEGAAGLNRVIFALFDLLVAASGDPGLADFGALLGQSRSLVNHAGIPVRIDAANLTRELGDDPLFLAERLAAANARYAAQTAELARLLGEAEARGEGGEGRRALGEFLAAARSFGTALKEDSQLSVQVAGAYHAANRKDLAHIQTHIGQNLVGLILLAGLILVVSVGYYRSRMAAERELQNHRDHLTELVELRTRELGEANDRLRAALREREILVKEVYHRVKNNLAMVAGLITLQKSDLSTGNLGEAFEKLSQRLRAISLIHEKLYRSADLSNIAFGDYVEDLCRTLIFSLAANPASIDFSLEAPELALPPDTLIPLGLIITELTTNSLKHAFGGRAGGRIEVSLHEEGEEFVLAVRDDGTPPSDEKLILESESLGASLVAGLVAQLRGRLDLDLAEGTRVIITFPRPRP